MATLSLDVTGRSLAELLALHEAMRTFDGRPEISAVNGVWHAGSEAYVELVFADGRRERVTLDIAGRAAA
jgi:hypothetical protein